MNDGVVQKKSSYQALNKTNSFFFSPPPHPHSSSFFKCPPFLFILNNLDCFTLFPSSAAQQRGYHFTIRCNVTCGIGKLNATMRVPSAVEVKNDIIIIPL